MTAPGVPPDRYRSGTRWKPRKWMYWAGLSVFVVAGLVIAYLGYENLGSGSDPISTTVSAYHVIDDHDVTVTFSVSRNHPDRGVDCIVDALSSDGSESGRREVYVPPSGTDVQLTTELRTYERATTGEIYGCSYQVPTYLTKSMPPSG